ncbi:hypothetical protein CDAR_40261 [Caerostris darwini]|uniref:Uncharacterized protein n=1 Tax=Caerostris darwini TaxID=1538125 RepID=A0AAV4RC55_9ARAC|nr:hypothetical protein CDAR_40261 [Caerostris darwini]
MGYDHSGRRTFLQSPSEDVIIPRYLYDVLFPRSPHLSLDIDIYTSVCDFPNEKDFLSIPASSAAESNDCCRDGQKERIPNIHCGLPAPHHYLVVGEVLIGIFTRPFR